MLKKIATSLFLIVYFSVSAVSFADEVVLEIVSEAPVFVVETIPEPVAENIPEEIISETLPVEEVAPPVVPWDVLVPTVISQEELPPEESLIENIAEPTPVEDNVDLLNALPEETMEEVVEDIPTTEEPQITELVEVEENSIFTPPGPEPEPWQPPVIEDPTTDNVPVWNTATQSDPQFLAENSVFVRRILEEVVVDSQAKHSCKVDAFHTNLSEQPSWLLSVHFYGTSLLASYDAEIGSLPNGIDVRFEKNNDYIYDFRGKETVLELTVTKQDSSLSGDFTIPIIYTQKGKKESSVICQLNIINEEEETSVLRIIPAEPIREPEQNFVYEILDIVADSEPVIETPTIIEEIFEVVTDNSVPDVSDTIPTTVENSIPEVPPPIIPPVALPEREIVPEPSQEDDVSTWEIVPEPISDIPPQENPVEPDLAPFIESAPVIEPAPIPLPDVSST